MNPHDHLWLSAYLDGELAHDQMEEAHQHLTTCSECAAELQEMLQLRGLIRDSLQYTPATSATDFSRDVIARLPDRPTREPPSRLWLWWAVPALVVVVSAFARAVQAIAQAVMAAAGLDPLGSLAEAIRDRLPSQILGLSLPGLTPSGLESAWWMDFLSSLALGLALNVIALLVLGLVIWSWLAAWHAFERHARLNRTQFGH